MHGAGESGVVGELKLKAVGLAPTHDEKIEFRAGMGPVEESIPLSPCGPYHFLQRKAFPGKAQFGVGAEL